MVRIRSAVLALFAVFTALFSFAFAAEEHGVVFPLTVDTETEYSADDNYYDDTDITSVRFSYTASGTGICSFTSSYSSSSFYRYVYFYGTDDTFTSYVRRISGSYSVELANFICAEGETYYFKVETYYDSYTDQLFTVKLTKKAASIVTYGSKADTVLMNSSSDIAATVEPGYNFVGWKVESGTGTFGDSKSPSTTFTPTSVAVSLSTDVKPASLYTLSDLYLSFTSYANGSMTADGNYGIRTVYEPAETGTYALLTKYGYRRYVYRYDDDGSFTSSSSYLSTTNNPGRFVYNLEAGQKYYFLLETSYPYSDTDTLSAKMAPTYKVNADTSGAGTAYVGTSSRNYDSSYVAGESVPLRAVSATDSRFEKWENVSGNCAIDDENARTTTVSIDGDCKVRAVFGASTMYPITTTATAYTASEHYYSDSPANGIRFYMVAPETGAYIVNIERPNNDWYYVYSYPSGTFSSSNSSKNTRYDFADTLQLSKGDSIFYLLKNEYISDSLETFKISYKTVNTYTVTLTSASENCKVDGEASLTVVEGKAVYVTGSAKSGFRTNGWKFVSGSHKYADSTSYSVRDTIDSDTKLELQCATAKLIDITNKPLYYNPRDDYYDVSPATGMYFRYVAPTTDLYIIQVQPADFYGSYYYYGADDTFGTPLKTISNSRYSSQVYWSATAVGDAYYVSTVPYSVSYYVDSLSIVARPASIVQVEGRATPDTVAIGEDMSLSATLDTGYHFVGWKLSTGKGTFLDKNSMSTTFSPSSANVKITKTVKKLPIYALTDKETLYTVQDNGVQVYNRYGVRTSYTAKKKGIYVLRLKQPNYSYVYNYGTDSTFYSYDNTTRCYNDCRIQLEMDAGDKLYYLFTREYTNQWTDSLLLSVLPVVKVNADTSGNGYAYVGVNDRNYDSTYAVGDTVPLWAVAGTSDSRFKEWRKVSGTCRILDSTKAVTSVVAEGDCKVKAVFSVGQVYKIVETPKAYSTEKDYYTTNPTYGVWFSFVAPSRDDYTFVFSGVDGNRLEVYRYDSSDFGSYTNSLSSGVSAYETLRLSKGDSVFYIVKNDYYSDSSKSFYVNYSTETVSIALKGGKNGTVTPSAGYEDVAKGAYYNISAVGKSGYRFSKWKIVSGNGKLLDATARNTLVSAEDDITVKASFKTGDVYEVTDKPQTFNFRTHYYCDSSESAIRFTWTPPDTNVYLLRFKMTDSLQGYFASFGQDSSFETEGKKVLVSGDTSLVVQGIPGIPLYWTFAANSYGAIPDKSFELYVSVPYLMLVESRQGRAIPSGNVYLEPGKDTLVRVVPYGGYVFDSWTLVEGKAKIDDPTNVKTRIQPQSEYCRVQANYVLDFSVEPTLEITGMDISSHPGICTQVSVTDQNTGSALFGLDSSNFILFQDNKALPVQVTTTQDFGGVAVALVVDESGSMSDEISDVREAVRQFIDEMNFSDRTAIIGFESSGRVIQPMTSDKGLLYEAVDDIHASGGTAINNGAYIALEQLKSEVNGATIIIFSDGYGAGSYTSSEIIQKALGQNTVIYSVGVGTGVSTEPLKSIAEGTGGIYTEAPSASDLSAIYASIQGTVQARYTLCYQSPDTELNGDSHEVIVKTNFVNKNAVDTAYWNEDAMPPQVTLTKETWNKVGVNQPQKDSIEITVLVTSKEPLASVRIFVQKSNLQRQSYTSYEMEHVKDSLWRYVVPASNALPPGIDFYVVATDSLSLIGKTPLLPNPAKEPYTIPIRNEVPEVTFADVSCVDTTGGTGYMAFDITDDDGVYNSSLYYKDSVAVLFNEVAMNRNFGDRWLASIPAEKFTAGKIEYYVRAKDGDGAWVRYEKKSNHKISACEGSYQAPDEKDVIKIVNAEEDSADAPVIRATTLVGLTLEAQDFSVRIDTVKAKLSCLVSGDVESDIVMVEKRSGYFENRDTIPKNEWSAKKNDGKISCMPVDTLVAEFKDPVYGTFARDTVVLADKDEYSYQFLEVDDENDLDSVNTSRFAEFRLRVRGPSASLTKVDTLKVLLFTEEGDSLWVKAVETDIYSSMFDYEGTFYFAEDSASLKDSRLDGIFRLDTSYNRVLIYAQAPKDKSDLDERDSLVVFSDYVPADSAEIYDSDLDGQADFIRIHFMLPLEDPVENVDTVYWNVAGGDWRKVSGDDLDGGVDDEWVSAYLEDSFDYGLTAPDSIPPYIRVTKTEKDFSQKVYVTDRVGAVPAKAEKRPGTYSMEEFMEEDGKLPPDTLVITLSEPIRKKGKGDAWQKLFRYSPRCKDTLDYPLNIAGEPEVDSTGTVWTVVLGDFNMVVGQCIRTNPKASYKDLNGNGMGRGGVEIEGDNGDMYLYEVAPNPAVSGLDKKVKWIPPQGESWVKVPDTLSTIKIAAVAPYKAQITIFDDYSNVVASFKQSFGYDGEMDEDIRTNSENRAAIGFLYWNQRTDEGRKVGTGVYIWRIDFKFKDGHKEFRVVKTGIRRKN